MTARTAPLLRRGALGAALLALAVAPPASLSGQSHESDEGPRAGSSRPAALRPLVYAVPRVGDIALDGRLEDDAWRAAKVMSGFVQSQPVEGRPAVHDTEVRVLFDDEAVYIGLRMWDPEPTGIARQLFRRDDRGQADQIEVAFDPNLDRRTGYLFGVTAANVQRDEYLYDDEREDSAWDAVWESEVQVDAQGWTAEMRIPLSQMRYEASDDPQTWGFNVHRVRLASNERSYLSLVSRVQRGTVSQFGRMEGVVVRRPPRRLEALPYVVGSLHRAEAEAGDPFFDGRATNQRVGVDLSYGLGAAFTLDATINPDFGQVEADPAVINLSAFETFFREQRPFFVEDARIFDFGLSGGRNSLFYSRRIGRSPHGGGPDEAAFESIPNNATILGAAKLAGRTSSGLSIGALAAVTDSEQGRALLDDGARTDFLVEPRSEFGVVSLQQDFNEGASNVGGIFTGMRRNLPGDGSFDFLPSTAYNAGVRFEHQWNQREWALWGFFAGSHVRGNEESILRLQQASNHYFQRPDATRLDVDSTATSMTGAEWRLQFERRSGEHWTGAVWAAQVTKGFEINDVGFSQSNERIDGGVRIGYREITPGTLFRSYNANFSTYHNWSHEVFDDVFSLSSWHGARTSGSYNLRGEAEFLNYWNVNADVSYSPRRMSRTATRGGPVMVDPASSSVGFRVNSDRRSNVSFGANVDFRDDHQGTGGQKSVGTNVTVRPSERLEVRLEPRMNWENSGAQYVTSTDVLPYSPTFGTRYVFSDLERRTFSMETRLDWTFTPKLSLQLFAQPLISSGAYQSYKQLNSARSFEFVDYTEGVATEADGVVVCQGGSRCERDGTQYVDLDGDGATDFSFEDRDFNVRSLVGNAVLRWEYRPGSAIFFVWQRQQVGSAGVGNFDLGRDVGALFDAPSDDRFIVKMNYWLGL